MLNQLLATLTATGTGFASFGERAISKRYKRESAIISGNGITCRITITPLDPATFKPVSITEFYDMQRL